MRNYGIPYKGSKNKIAKKIIEFLPEAKHLYDLFGGGGAISHAALESGKWGTVHYNELNKVAYSAFTKALNGDFKNETRWVSRSDFFENLDKDPYVACCFSFGNDFRTYLYSREIEPYKKAFHYAVVLDKWDELKELCPETWQVAYEACEGKIDTRERRLAFANAVCNELKRLNDWDIVNGNPFYKSAYRKSRGRLVPPALQSWQNLENLRHIELERLERLNRLVNLERLERLQGLSEMPIENTNLSYEDVPILPNSVIYCDIPYIKTNKYNEVFDYETFYDWCSKQTVPVFISSYEMPEDKFRVVWESSRNCSMSAKTTSKVMERIFVPI